MTRWEYLSTSVMGKPLEFTWDKWLNQLGQDGWELVGIEQFGQSAIFYFKRPVEEAYR